MKKLLLIRHAEAVGYAKNGDFARALSDNGLKGAATTAEQLRNKSLIPQAIISSPAMRTSTTAQTIAQTLNIAGIQFNEAIYEASEQTLLGLINQFDNQYNFIALVGHNPGIAYLLHNLTNEIREVLPGTAILISFDVQEWEAISQGTGSITYYFAP